jgi:hypothetical protein
VRVIEAPPFHLEGGPRRFFNAYHQAILKISASEEILLQNDFERSATKFLIQGFNGQRKIDSSGGLLGFDCCVLDACRRLLQHNRRVNWTGHLSLCMSQMCQEQTVRPPIKGVAF